MYYIYIYIMNKIPNFKIWYKDYDDSIVSYNYLERNFERSLIPPSILEMNCFYLPKNMQIKSKKRDKMTYIEYDAYLKSQVISYSEIIIKEHYELLKSETLKIKFDYFDNTYKFEGTDQIYYRTHSSNVRTFFKRLCKNGNNYKYKDFEDVFYSEYKWFKKCSNGGLQYLKEKGVYKNTYGYDFKMSYPTDMADISFMMPTKKGKECFLKEIPANKKFIQFGIYRVKIECEAEFLDDFKKIFKINDEFESHHYTSYSLKFAFKVQKKFNLKITLIKDSQPNAYIYKKEDLISGKNVFGNWYYRLKELKTELPKNGLVKMLSSSVWGHLQEVKLIYVDEPELIEMIDKGKRISDDGENLDYLIVDMAMVGDRTRYALINPNEKIYDVPMRLLPFITSFSRTKMGNLINKNDLYDKVIRVQTDSITFTEKFEKNIEGFIFDKKISGDLIFHQVNDYEPLVEWKENELKQYL